MDISGGHYSDDNTGLIDDLLIKELGLKWGCGHADRGVRMNQACFVLEELADWGVGAHRQRMTIHCDKDCREVRIVQHQEECGARWNWEVFMKLTFQYYHGGRNNSARGEKVEGHLVQTDCPMPRQGGVRRTSEKPW